MKKYFIILSFFSLLLTACSGSETDSNSVDLIRQSFKTFSIDVPINWKKIIKNDFANTIPEETVAIFLNKIEGSDFIQNVSIVKESLNTDASSLEYAKANILLGSKALIDYRALSTEELKIDSQITVLHSFRARNTTTEPLRSYFQTYFTQNRIGYTVTCLTDGEDLTQESSCRAIVSNFRLRL